MAYMLSLHDSLTIAANDKMQNVFNKLRFCGSSCDVG